MTVRPAFTASRRRVPRSLLLILPAVFLGVFFFWPSISLLGRGIGEGGAGEALSSGRTWRALGTTLGLATAGTIGSVMLGMGAAWALYRIRWPGQSWARALVTVPFVLPPVVVAAAFGALLRPSGLLGFLGADQGLIPIVGALVFFNVSVVSRIVGGTWAALGPGATVAARTLGASRWRAFRHVTLPTLGPAIGAAASIVFLFCSTSFAIVLVLGGTRTNTVETEMWLQVNQFLNLGAAAGLALLQVAVVGLTLAAAAWARSHSERRLPRDRVDGTRAATRQDALLSVAALAPTAFLLALPLIGLVQRSFATSDGWGLGNYVALFRPPGRAILSVSVWRAALTSLEAATIATTIACGLGLIVASASVRGKRGRWVDTAAMLPLGVSSVVVGLGILLTLYRPLPGGLDLGDPRILVPAAQAVVGLPLVVRSLTPAMRAIPPHLRAAAATLGATPRQVWRHVDWPLVRRPVGVAVGLAFAVALGEFGATSYVARPDHPTLPTAIFRLLSRPGIENVGMAFAACVLLAAMTAMVVLVSERWRGREVAGI